MASDWISNPGAVDRVKELLEHAGVPLELKVSEICDEFCTSHPDADISSQRVVYSSVDTTENFREVDQNVVIYKEFKVRDSTLVQLISNIPIECKYRKDIEIFAFPLGQGDFARRFPAYSNFCGSDFFRILRNAFNSLSKVPHASVVPLEIRDGETPKKAHKENLIYNAAGALYDFVKHDVSAFEEEPSYSDRLLDALGLFEEFEEYLSSGKYLWRDALRHWFLSLDKQKYSLFSERYHGRNPAFHSVITHLPVVCVNGPIYSTIWNAHDGIESFQEMPYALVDIRKSDWPGSAYLGLMTRSPEVPTILTNQQNLLSALEIGLQWHEEICETLTEASIQELDSWPLQASMFHRVMRDNYHREAKGGYRSDFAEFDI